MRSQWERRGVLVGVLIALAIMWGVLAYALVSGEGSDGGNSPSIIYDNPSGASTNAQDDDER